MNKTKCPKCGLIQNKQEAKQSVQMKMFMGFLESQGSKIITSIECEKCKTCFEQDKHTIENQIQIMAQEFVDKYFNSNIEYENEKIKLTENDWMGGEIGGVLGVRDYFFNVEFMQDALKLNATYDEMTDFYWVSFEKPKLEFKDYVEQNRIEK